MKLFNADIFLDQKRVNVCKHVVKTTPWWEITTRVGAKQEGASIPSTALPSCLAPTLVVIFQNSHMVLSLLCVHKFTLFRKTSDVEMFQLSFHVFVCGFLLEISSFFRVRVSSFFLIFVILLLIMPSCKKIITHFTVHRCTSLSDMCCRSKWI